MTKKLRCFLESNHQPTQDQQCGLCQKYLFTTSCGWQPKILLLVINFFSLNFTSIEIEVVRGNCSQNERTLGGGRVLENKQRQIRGEEGLNSGILSEHTFWMSPKTTYLPKGIVNNCIVIIHGKNFYNQPIDSDIKWYEEIRKSLTWKGEDYTTSCLLDYELSRIIIDW